MPKPQRTKRIDLGCARSAAPRITECGKPFPPHSIRLTSENKTSAFAEVSFFRGSFEKVVGRYVEQFARIYGTMWAELNDYSSIENMPRILEYFFITSSPKVNESGFTYTVDYADVGIDSGQCSSMVHETVGVYYNCLVEISVSDIGSTVVSTSDMPKAVQNFKNMVGEVVSTEGPAYQ